MHHYPYIIRKLPLANGNGYIAEAIDLDGCIADGETAEEAICNLEDAIKSWIRTAEELGKPVPPPSNNSCIKDNV